LLLKQGAFIATSKIENSKPNRMRQQLSQPAQHASNPLPRLNQKSSCLQQVLEVVVQHKPKPTTTNKKISPHTNQSPSQTAQNPQIRNP
jgi:hypothetical protein